MSLVHAKGLENPGGEGFPFVSCKHVPELAQAPLVVDGLVLAEIGMGIPGVVEGGLICADHVDRESAWHGNVAPAQFPGAEDVEDGAVMKNRIGIGTLVFSQGKNEKVFAARDEEMRRVGHLYRDHGVQNGLLASEIGRQIEKGGANASGNPPDDEVGMVHDDVFRQDLDFGVGAEDFSPVPEMRLGERFAALDNRLAGIIERDAVVGRERIPSAAHGFVAIEENSVLEFDVIPTR